LRICLDSFEELAFWASAEKRVALDLVPVQRARSIASGHLHERASTVMRPRFARDRAGCDRIAVCAPTGARAIIAQPYLTS